MTTPAHTPETQCCEQVSDGGRWPSFHQCTRKAVTTEGGKPYCKTHTPSLIAEKRDSKNKEYEEAWKKKKERMKREAECIRACAGIPAPESALRLAVEALEHALRASDPEEDWDEIAGKIQAALAAITPKEPKEIA